MVGAPLAGGGLGLGRLRVSRKHREQVSWWPWYLHPQREQTGDDQDGGREGGTEEAESLGLDGQGQG